MTETTNDLRAKLQAIALELAERESAAIEISGQHKSAFDAERIAHEQTKANLQAALNAYRISEAALATAKTAQQAAIAKLKEEHAGELTIGQERIQTATERAEKAEKALAELHQQHADTQKELEQIQGTKAYRAKRRADLEQAKAQAQTVLDGADKELAILNEPFGAGIGTSAAGS